MTKDEVLKELESFGNEQTKKIFMRHGAKEPFFGVKVGDLKKIVKKTKKNHELSLELFSTGNSDAMYLAGLIADEEKITKANLQSWIKSANWFMLADYSVASVAAESKHGWELALEWIKSDREMTASGGWSTLSNLVSIKEDSDLDLVVLGQMLDHIESNIHESENRVRYTMNGFVIAVGSYVKELSERAKEVASNIGKVNVYMGKTSCKVPLASEYIDKVIDKGRLGLKRKIARC